MRKLIFILVIAVLASCRSSKVAKTIESKKIDSIANTSIDSSKIKKIDNSTKIATQTVHKKKENKKSESTIEIKFDTTSTKDSIIINHEGKITVISSGKKPKSLIYKEKNDNSTKETENSKTDQEDKKAITDSGNVKKESSIKLKAQEFIKNVSRKTCGFSWLDLLWLIPVIAVIYIVRKIIKIYKPTNILKEL